MSEKKIRICCVLVSYELAPEICLIKINKLSQKLNFEIYGVIISNKSIDINKCRSNFDIINGTNKYRDISGYKEGLEYFKENSLYQDECILFMNDSIFIRHNPYIILKSFIEKWPTIIQVDSKLISGKTDRYVSIINKNSWADCSVFVSTFAFALNNKSKNILYEWEGDAISHNIITDLKITDKMWGANLPVNLREYFRCHLLYDNSVMNWKPYKYSSSETLIHKSYNIHFEQWLTGRICDNGVLIPINDSYKSRFKIEIFELFTKMMSFFFKDERLKKL
jgi:hypothetical protein